MTTPLHPDRAPGPADHRAAVATETARFVAALDGADLTTPVPACPGWTLADLVRHTGSVQRWFSVLLRGRVQEPPRSRDVDLRLPDGADGWPGWLTASAAEAADAFAATGPDVPMYAWGADQHARFWARRMLFETLVHRTDAERALRLDSRVDRALALDGIDEFLVNLPFAGIFAPRVAELRGTGETVRFHATDGDPDGPGDWWVRLRPDGFGLDPAARTAQAADATVRGTAADLLLLLYGRLPHDAAAFTLDGDRELLARWCANSAF
ncbi:maleylpyruvate isomerase family mycothiol-dependent enzyme [Kitasatospora sp. NPDC088346]|uniref:maleylpyruvate isomerase family mycothiol-dependent enzyme n=1 Tax=Kitasatospora sp. NPDC088346 TaxID=3364073 RepID=UPI00380AACB7